MSKPDIADVLASVNALRLLHSVGEPLTEMPKGTPMSACVCPLATALSSPGREMSICAETWGPTSEEESHMEYETPSILAQFIRAFDDRKYPELIAEAA